MMSSKSMRQLGVGLTVVAALILPWVFTGYHLFQTTQILIYAIAILGLNVLTGYNGQISLGHGAFFAIGAYAAAILISHAGVSYWLAVPIAGIVSFSAGALFGLPALKLEGHYLALATFGLALSVPPLVKHAWLEDWTGGVQGLFVVGPEIPFGLHLNIDQWIYYFVLAFVLVVFWGVSNLLRGRIGRAIVAVRDHQVAALSMGVNASFIKTVVFGISALCTGLAGALSSILIQFVSPDSFALFFSIFLLVGSVVGGVASVPGAFIGAVFIVVVPNISSSISQSAPGLIYGLLLLLFVYLMPGGVWGALRNRTFDRPLRLSQGGTTRHQPEKERR